MPDKIRNSDWTAKSCDICGESEDLSLLGSRTVILPSRLGRYEFKLEDVICGRCGFVYAGKVPSDEFLNDFYRDAFTLESDIKRIEPDFNPDKRLEIIKKQVPEGASIFEVGAATGEFCRILNDKGYHAEGIDPLVKSSDHVAEKGLFSSCGNGTVTDLMDAAVSYYVLEHVTRPREWIKEVKRHLRPGGILITEVPHFTRNPDESLYPQHMLHWTPVHLEVFLESFGFESVMTEERVISRSFGFVNVARLAEPDMDAMPSRGFLNNKYDVPRVFKDGTAAYGRGIQSRQNREKVFDDIGAKLIEMADMRDKTKIFFWPVNDISASISERIGNVTHVIPVDSSSSKIGSVYPGFNAPTSPPEFPRTDMSHRIFVLCSPSWNREIRKQLESMNLIGIEIVDGTGWQ